MKIQRRALYLLRINADLFCLVAGALFSLQVTGQLSALSISKVLLLNVFIVLVWLLSSKSTNLYDEFRGKYFSFEAISTLKNTAIITVSLIVIMYVINLHLIRFFLAVFAFTSLNFILIEKYFIRRVLILIRARGRNLRSLLIIGSGEVGMQFHDDIKDSMYGYRLIGFLDDEKNTELNGEYLGEISKLNNILAANEVDEVIVALPGYATDKLDRVIKICERYATKVKVIPDYFRYATNQYNISVLGRFPVIALREERVNEIHWRLVKRSLDLGISLIAFVFIFSWLWPLIAVLIKLDTPGKVLFKQERWGKNNRMFNAYKFRSMYSDASMNSPDGRFIPTSRNDQRITKVGRVLRKYNLDELPQFINVLKGEMSIVGPRPHPTPLNLEAQDMINHYMLRHLVKPGLSGWAQVKGFRGEITEPVLMEKRVEHDLWYIENWTLMLDIQIMFLTVWNMIKGDPNAY